MPPIKTYLYPFLSLLLLVFVNISCNKERHAKPLPTEVGQYVYAFTTGVVSKNAPIRIQLTGIVASPEQIGQPANFAILDITPNVAGTLVWEDRQTLVLQPDQPLEGGRTYIATVDLTQLYENLPEAARTFEFEFTVREQMLAIEVGYPYNPDPARYEEQAIDGTLITADLAKATAIEATLTARQDGRALPVTWEHPTASNRHTFTISGIDRQKQTGEVKITYDGKPIGARQQDETIRQVSALDDFSILSVRANGGASPHLEIHFSDPVAAEQNLAGLVTVNNTAGGHRYLVQGNRVLVYPSGNVQGERTVRIDAGIRNSRNNRLGKVGQYTVDFTGTDPQVRLVGNGVIMPDGEGMLFPFEAVGLNAVEVEIFQVFSDNVLQFLQNNDLNGSNQLQEVGRIVLRQKVDLFNLNPEYDATNWNRYALELNQLMAADRNAIYQVRIGFRPTYASNACPTATESSSEEDPLDPERSNERGDPSIMDLYYGFGGYYNGYRWDQRDNPCSPAYYNASRFVARNILSGNLGLTVKSGDDKNYLVVVNDLRTTQPIGGARVTFYDFQQQKLGESKTGNNGFARVQLARKPYVAIATTGSDKGYLRLSDGESLAHSAFAVDGSRVQKGLKGFLYGDRGVWRPGDSVYLNFILEDRDGTLPPNYPVQFLVRDARGQVQFKRTATAAAGTIYPLHFATSPADPTGIWYAEVAAGGAKFSQSLRIETVRPNRLGIELTTPGNRLTSDSDSELILAANWLYGAPASGLKAEVEMSLQADHTGFSRFREYAFHDPGRSIEQEPIRVFDGNLDAGGRATIPLQSVYTRQAPGKLKAAFRTQVFEPGGDFSTDNLIIPFAPYTAFAGVKLPTNQWGSKELPLGEAGTIDFAAVDATGTPLPARQLSVGLYRVEWRWWWDDGYDNVRQYNSQNHLNALERAVVTTNQKGQAVWSPTVDQWGRYLVRVCDTETGHCAGDFFYAGSPSASDETNRGANIVMLQTDKATYNIGQNVNVTLPTPDEGRALVSLETGGEVLDAFWVDTKRGETKITFKATEAMAPTVYANISLLQPHQQTANDLPIRMYGVIPLQIENPESHIEPQIKMPETLRPDASATVQVREDKGRPMAYTLAVVDEGLLGLTRFQTPDAWAAFYAKEALGVRTWDLYDQVMGAFAQNMQRILTVGGGDMVNNPDNNQANRFEPVVRHYGPYYLQKNGKAEHTIDIHNYVGAVRVMVVAATEEGAYGKAEKTVPVKQPLMVLSSLPRQLSPGETLQLPVNVFTTEDRIKQVQVSLAESSGLVEVIQADRALAFAKKGDQLTRFALRVGEREGVARFKVTARGNGQTATEEIEIAVRNPNTVETRIRNYTVEPGQSLAVEYQPFGTPGTRASILEVSNLPPLNLGERLNYLLQYPYGCLEQTLSGGFPQLYVQQLLELDAEQQEKIPRNIAATIDRLKLFQLPDGGMAYWPGARSTNQWSTTYAGHFLLEAKDRGYTLPPGMLDRWLDYQQRAAKDWTPHVGDYGYVSRHYYDLSQAYRLYTLALANQADLSAMNQLREQQGLSKQARWRLAAAYARAGKSKVAQDLIRNVNTDIQPYRELSGTYGSDTRDRAMLLETFVLLDDRARAADLVQRLSKELSSRNWYSTQDISFALLAIGKYVGENEVSRDYQFEWRPAGAAPVTAGGDRAVVQLTLADNGTNQTRQGAVQNTSQQRLFVTTIVHGQPLTSEATAAAENLRIAIEYVDASGQPLAVERIPQGTDFTARVTVTHPGSLNYPFEELALSQIFPGGWEINNTRMDATRSERNDQADYRDYRDDRVNTFFDLGEGDKTVFEVNLTAAYAGKYYLPPTTCEAMYDNSIFARAAGRWVEVVL